MAAQDVFAEASREAEAENTADGALAASPGSPHTELAAEDAELAVDDAPPAPPAALPAGPAAAAPAAAAPAAAVPAAAVPAAAALPAVGAGVWAAAVAMGDPAVDHLSALAERKRTLEAERQRLALDIRNAERKKARLVERARGLSDVGLMQIVASRAVANAKANAKATAKAKAKANAKGKGRGKGDDAA